MVLALIPARMQSVRLPGKVLADVGGRPLVYRVWERARQAQRVTDVWVATEDDAVEDALSPLGVTVVRTGPARCGTERIAQVRPPPGVAWILNVQGDEPFVEPSALDTLLDAMRAADAPIGTLCAPLPLAEAADPSRVKVACHRGFATSFSRHLLPVGGPALHHVGVYAFRAELLPQLAALPPHPWEQAEQLEQLRWMAAGWPILVAPVPHAWPGVDTPAGLEAARHRWERLYGPPQGALDA